MGDLDLEEFLALDGPVARPQPSWDNDEEGLEGPAGEPTGGKEGRT